MLKSFNELNKIDVTPYCEYKKSKNDNGQIVEIPYLNWAKCKSLLHENGAELVYFTPIMNSNGSYLFESKQVANKDGRQCGCYFVKVEIHIDDKVFTMDTPLLNGSLVIYDDTLNQLRISNAHARAFVKGVAIHTGLGFSLWLKETDEDKALRTLEEDDLTIHNLFAIKKRIEEELTSKIISGKTKDEVLKAIGLNEKAFNTYMGYFDRLNKLEQAIKGIK